MLHVNEHKPSEELGERVNEEVEGGVSMGAS